MNTNKSTAIGQLSNGTKSTIIIIFLPFYRTDAFMLDAGRNFTKFNMYSEL